MVKGNHYQCSATACCMTCITSMRTFWWPSIVGAIFQELQPKQGCFFSAVSSPYKAIYMHISQNKSNLITVYILCMIFLQGSRPHTVYLLKCYMNQIYPPTQMSTVISTDCLYLCDACTLRVVHIILHNCKFIFPPTPPGWNIYQVAEASFVIHLCDLLVRTWDDQRLTVVNSWDMQMETLYFWKPKL